MKRQRIFRSNRNSGYLLTNGAENPPKQKQRVSSDKQHGESARVLERDSHRKMEAIG